MESVRKAVDLPIRQEEESYGQGSMGNAGLYFVNRVFCLLCFSDTLTLNVHCEVSDVLDYKILFVSESKKASVMDYALQKIDICHYYLSITGLDSIRKSHFSALSSLKSLPLKFISYSESSSLTRETSTCCHRSQHIHGQ